MLKKGSFVAAYLDESAIKGEKQLKLGLGTVKKNMAKQGGADYKYLYVASRNSSKTDAIRAEAKKSGVTVLERWELLPDLSDIDYLEKELGEEHRVLVDYLVSLRSGWFVGEGSSSLSINTAAKRHSIEGWKGKSIGLKDEWSYLTGKIDKSIVEGTWP
ncbi:hypothetical protein ABW20_dc0109514 [Dactylellina cionopaga]|nr:hypothetical protein ABW20_dc0109514 [Dactylellina cionopaga]